MIDGRFMSQVLGIFADTECHEDLIWSRDRSNWQEIRFSVLCSDTFDYATADSEEITPENVATLYPTYLDLSNGDHEVLWPTLWCARQRKRRPMPLYYEHLKLAGTPLGDFLDAAGPERIQDS